MHTRKDPLTGCRPSQFVGPWAMPQQELDELRAQVEMMLNAGQYEVVARESKAMAEEDKQSSYEVDRDGVAHFSVNGPMTRHPTSLMSMLGGTSTMLFERSLSLAASDPDVVGAMLHIDSPGGTASCMADLTGAVDAFKKLKPVQAHIQGHGTSLAYALAAASNHISIDPMGVAGSVGAITKLRDTSKLMERAGVKDEYFASGDRKAIGAPGRAITDEHREYTQDFINELGTTFVNDVARRRKIGPDSMKDIARAGIYSAERAKAIGLVDSIASTEQAITQFKQSLSSGSGVVAAETDNSDTPSLERSNAMPLTAEQLAKVQAWTGLSNVTAEDAFDRFYAQAEAYKTDASTAASRVTQLETELASAKPVSLPAPVLKAMQGSTRILMQSAVDKQAVTPAVAEALAAHLIGTDEAPSAVGLAPGASGECLAAAVFSALALNGAAPKVGETVKGQPAPKATPGKPEEAKPVTPERKTELLEMSGVSAK